MSIKSRLAAAGMTATLLAGLVGTTVAPAALADFSVTGVGVVPAGGTSTTAASFTFNDITSRDGTVGEGFCTLSFPATLTLTILDADSLNTVHFVGTPTIVAPSTLGASVSVADNVITVTITGCDPNNNEQFTVGGLKISADTDAAVGAIQATLGGSAAGVVANGTTTATGTLANFYAAGATVVLVNVTSTCHFTAGSATIATDGTNGAETRTVTAVTTSGSQDQLTFSAATGNAHNLGSAVSETVANCATLSPGSVGASVLESTKFVTSVQAGQNNQNAGEATIVENNLGALTANTVVTFAISATGVTFSHAPTASWAGDWSQNDTSCALAFDLKSCSVTIPATSDTTVGSVTLDSIQLDVASTVAPGTAVNLNVTTSPSVPVVVDSNTIAYVGRVLVGIGALPTVYIGYNAQPTGLVTVSESGAGFFQSGSGGNNALQICVYGYQGESFTFAPYAIVTAGDLKLLNPSTLLGVTSQQATLSHHFNGTDCATWYVYSGSTVASTITIVGATASGPLSIAPNNGPTMSIPSTAVPGPLRLEIATGTQAVEVQPSQLINPVYDTIVTNAVRAFKSGVVVSAVSQPNIAPGTTGAAGDITISETLNGQLQAGEYITCQVVDSTYSRRPNHQVLLSEAIDNNLPVVTTNTETGLVAYRLAYDQQNNAFTIYVLQQASAPGLGKITISNLHYTVVTGATPGPVTVDCYRSDQNEAPMTGTPADFDAFISNAIVGAAPTMHLSTGSALGVTKIGPFTTSTKVAKLNKYITWRFVGGAALAGKTVDIYVATKGATSWSAFTKVTARVADASGNVYYWLRSASAKWVSVRIFVAAGPNNPASWSPATQGRWK